jgi:amino acid transporter
MPEILGAVVGAIAVIGIPLVAWFSRRATQEGRLTLRVERLGTVYALMPNSAEKETFKSHLTGTIASLNSWLDPDNARRRRIIHRVSIATYVVCLVVVLCTAPFVDTARTPWFTSVLGVVIGLVVSLITFGTSYLLERSTRIKRERDTAEREEAAAATRMDALRRGEALPMSSEHSRTATNA